MSPLEKSISQVLSSHFLSDGISVKQNAHVIEFTANNKKLSCWHDEWNEKQEIILARLKSMLSQNKKIHGRTCTIKLIQKKEAEEFLNDHHILGFAKSYYKLGLFKGDELLAIATFSKGRKMNRLEENKRSFELIRFTNKSGYTVVGGLSKLLNHFILLTQAGDIMTYIDKLQSDGDSFIKLGFKMIDETNPIEFMVDKKTGKRMELKSNLLTDEMELIKNKGNLKLVYTPN